VARLHVVAVSARLPAWAESACADYLRRMPKGYEVARIDARPDRLRASLPKGARIVALDERGKDYTTVQFSKLLGEETAFVIGGPDGLDDGIRNEAKLLLRLSSLTLPHALAQIVLIEQIYRAATLLTGHPYHRS
jgi:23S rRNA (pseudouridine1915-N3)-methyltransferase